MDGFYNYASCVFNRIYTDGVILSCVICYMKFLLETERYILHKCHKVIIVIVFRLVRFLMDRMIISMKYHMVFHFT